MAIEAPAATLGLAAPAFALSGTDGRTYTLDDVRGPRGLVVAFICNHCPYVSGALPALIRDALELRALGIGMVGINANDGDTHPADAFEPMIAFAETWRLPFPYLHDATQDVARAYDAVCTPECHGFDANLQLRYRGRVDASRKEPLPDAPRDLFDAMTRVVQMCAGPAVQYPALGCSIKWKHVDA